MPDISTLALFAAASLALTLVPGPAVLYIVARGVEGGRASGLASALGVGAGGLAHVVFAVAGLSALVASSATAFSVVKWLGVAYLLWLGLSRLLGGDAERESEPPDATRVGLPGAFFQGVLVNVLNPKTALIFLAFVPQFVEPSRGTASAQIALLGAVFVLLALFTDCLYALLSGTASEWLKRKNEGQRFRRGQRYLSGGIYLALAAASAATGSGKN